MNAVSYIRISTEEQSKYSLDSQERVIREYCERNKVKLIASFKDDGAHSDTFDRPDYNALEAFLRQKKDVQFLVIYDHSRFSRSLAEALMKCAELQKKFQLTVLTINDPIDIDFTDPTAFMIRAFQFMQAEAELHNIRKRTKSGMVQAALDGRYAAPAPYGYKNERDGNNKPVLGIVEEKALIVRFFFREYLLGTNIEQLRATARELGYKQSGNSAVRRILSNPVYAGMIPVPAHKGRRNKYSKGIHTPLVSEQDYWLVQERLSGKSISTQVREEVPLRGVLHCWCGRKVTAGNSRGRAGRYYWYYLCQEHRQSISASRLHAQFNSLLDELSLSPRSLQWLQTKMAAEIGAHLNTRGEQMAEISRKIKLAERQIETTERKFLLQPDLSEATYSKVIAELRADLAILQRQMMALNTNQQDYYDRLRLILPRLSYLRESYEGMPLEKKQQFVNLVFDNNLYYENGIYRTTRLHPLLSGNELTLKEKGLLIIQKPLPVLGQTPVSTRDGSGIQVLAELLELIA